MLSGGNVNEQWRQMRLSCFTSSQIHNLCAPKGFGKEGKNYIRSRVFEAIARIPADPEVNTMSTVHGLVEEGFGIKAYIERRGINPRQVVVQKLIYGEIPQYACTPDGIYCMNESTDGLSWNVEVWETKCYQPKRHMEMLEAKTPAELKSVNDEVYHQVLDQMLNVDCLDGKAIFFHPALPLEQGGLHVIDFRKRDLVAELKFLNQRKTEALAEFNRLFELHTKKKAV
jgi:YqaJ-like recombinase protein